MTAPIEPATDAEIERLTKRAKSGNGRAIFIDSDILSLIARIRAQTAPAEVVGEVEPEVWMWRHPKHTGNKWCQTENPNRDTKGAEYLPFIPALSTPTQAEAREAGIRAALAAVEELPVGGEAFIGIHKSVAAIRALLTEGEARC